PKSAVGVVLLTDRRAKHTEGAVALELVHPAPLAGDRPHDDLEEAVEQADDLVRRLRLRQRRGADEIDEQSTDLAALTPEGDVLLEGLTGHVLADIAAEEVFELTSLAKPGNHPVEAGLKLADLAAVVHRDLDREVVALHALDGLPELTEGVGRGGGRHGRAGGRGR